MKYPLACENKTPNDTRTWVDNMSPHISRARVKTQKVLRSHGSVPDGKGLVQSKGIEMEKNQFIGIETLRKVLEQIPDVCQKLGVPDANTAALQKVFPKGHGEYGLIAVCVGKLHEGVWILYFAPFSGTLISIREEK